MSDESRLIVERKSKPYKDLTFTDDYMFCKVLENDMELCRQLLNVILDMDIRKVVLADAQHRISITSDIKSVRLDVYLNDDEGTVFDLEMQAAMKPEIPRRSRYYQSIIDIAHLESGMKYTSLPDSYIVFLCTFDPFGKGLPKYEFRSVCISEPSIGLDDGTSKIFINAKCEHHEMSRELRALLDYLCGKEPSSNLTKYISDSVLQAKCNSSWERDYMLFEEKLREEREEGRAEGLMEGRAAMVLLMKYLCDNHRYEDIDRITRDPDYLELLLAEAVEHQDEISGKED